MPASIVCARRKDLNPIISFIRRLMFLWSCSIRLFSYLLCLTAMLSSSDLPVLSVVQRRSVGASLFHSSWPAKSRLNRSPIRIAVDHDFASCPITFSHGAG
jgi:hypothetical protein